MSGHDVGMDTEMSADNLRGAKPFDDKCIAMGVPHHEGAVEMARMELEPGGIPSSRRLRRR